MSTLLFLFFCLIQTALILPYNSKQVRHQSSVCHSSLVPPSSPLIPVSSPSAPQWYRDTLLHMPPYQFRAQATLSVHLYVVPSFPMLAFLASAYWWRFDSFFVTPLTFSVLLAHPQPYDATLQLSSLQRLSLFATPVLASPCLVVIVLRAFSQQVSPDVAQMQTLLVSFEGKHGGVYLAEFQQSIVHIVFQSGLEGGSISHYRQVSFEG
mmetsp:Transcript_43745/g.52986  ORF Transcript_43745/g.52986 Transcript_43745/m.52986 type:complete len:209 (+) Transcript_43745:75-701(+)